jgi:hypothetical protein
VTPFNDAPQLCHALEEAVARRGVRAVVIDEAQHLMHVAGGATWLDQLDWLKSMSNTMGVVHVRVGTYDLLDFRNLSGQTARRGHISMFRGISSNRRRIRSRSSALCAVCWSMSLSRWISRL